jgi:alkylation response protein AidB-like acyl-CoA dehydrogenase
MNFEHTHERRLLAESMSRYVAERYGEPAQRLVPRAASGFDPVHWQALAEIGAVGALFGPDDGGLGGSAFDLVAVFEAIGRGLVCEPFLASLMAGRALSHAGDEMHAPLRAGIAEGAVLASLAHCERGGQWDPLQVECRARREADGWVLDGLKVGVPWGGEAQVLLVSARTAGAPGDRSGLSLFAVPVPTAGLMLRGHPDFDGGRSADAALCSVALPGRALVGREGEAAAALEAGIGCGILAVCAEAVGAMDVMLASTLDYLKMRSQFGVPIGSFQAVQHRMVDLMLQLEQARSATVNAAVHLETAGRLRERQLSAAKFTVGTAAQAFAEECIQLHGGIGMTWELSLAHHAKRLGLLNLQLGDEDFHLARYAAAMDPAPPASAHAEVRL